MSRYTLPSRRRRLAREWLAARHGARCFYCRTPFPAGLDGATLDHYVPYRLFRRSVRWNLVLACEPCNHAKGDALPWPLVWLLLARLDASRPSCPWTPDIEITPREWEEIFPERAEPDAPAREMTRRAA